MLTMTTEIYWLILTLSLTTLLWVPYILQLMLQIGPLGAMAEASSARSHGPEWPRRATRAHYNAIENIAVYAPLVLLVVLLKLNDDVTATAAIVFFFARLVHYVIYVFGIPVLRTFAFATGFACQMVMVLRLLGVI